MSQVIKYFKYKLRPLKNKIKSFENKQQTNEKSNDINKEAKVNVADTKNDLITNESKNAYSSIVKKKKKKNRLNVRIKRKIKKNLISCIESSSMLNYNSKDSITQDMSHYQASDELQQAHENLSDSPVSNSLEENSNLSSNTGVLNSTSCCNNPSTINEKLLNSNSSRSYDNSCVLSSSIMISTPTNNTNNSFVSSMVTYNTKYANSNLSDEDGLISINSTNISPSSTSQLLIPKSAVLSGNVKNNINNSMHQQQSTPFAENIAKIINLKSAQNPSMKLFENQHEDDEDGDENEAATNDKVVKKCRRSNTTYTLPGSKSNFQIIDYFNKLEFNKPVKKQAVIRRLKDENGSQGIIVAKQSIEKLNDSKYSINSTIESLNTTSDSIHKNEVEKIQDVLFYDEPSVALPSNDEATNNFSLQNNVADSQNEPKSLAMIDTPPSSIKSTNVQKTDLSSSLFKTPSPLKPLFDEANAKLNETNSVNRSMEKIRRSLSFPCLIQNNSPINADVSKISATRNCVEETIESSYIGMNHDNQSYQKDSTQKSDTTSEAKENTTKTIVDNQLKESGVADVSSSILSPSFNYTKDQFVRGEQQMRLSKNIKQMFKNVVKQQMNAINNLEKFYEAQVAKLEIDRKRNLEINPNNSEKINEFFDQQLKLLEERVQSNLKFICENKYNNNKNANENVEQRQQQSIQASASNKNTLSRRLSQLMILKQMELQQKKQQNNNITSANNNNTRISRSTLNELKTNLLTQNNLLPSKNPKYNRNKSSQSAHSAILSNSDSNTRLSNLDLKKTEILFNLINNTNSNDDDLKETLFKRNLSLPFQQCKQNPLLPLLKQKQNSKNNINEILTNNIQASASNVLKIRPPRIASATVNQNLASRIRPTIANQNLNHKTSNDFLLSQFCSAQNSSNFNLNKTNQFQYQKNIYKKYSCSNENISKLKCQSTENSNQSSLSKAQDNQIDNLNPKVETKAQQTRQNKSASSLKSNDQSLVSYYNQSQLADSTSSLFFGNELSNSGVLSKSNCSIFSNLMMDTSHLKKYQPPRFSDCHMHFRLNQQKMALLKAQTDMKTTSNQAKQMAPAYLNNATPQNSNKMNFLIETQV